MKGVRFYLEHGTSYRKRRKQHTGQVVAVIGRNLQPGMLDAIGSVGYTPNEYPASCVVSVAWLRLTCTRITEARAREIHPRLFTFLDD